LIDLYVIQTSHTGKCCKAPKIRQKRRIKVSVK